MLQMICCYNVVIENWTTCDIERKYEEIFRKPGKWKKVSEVLCYMVCMFPTTATEVFGCEWGQNKKKS